MLACWQPPYVWIQDFSASVKLLGTDLSAWSEEKRLTLLRFCVHCSDIGNPAKPLALSKQWTDRLMKEFAAQVCSARVSGLFESSIPPPPPPPRPLDAAGACQASLSKQ